MEMKNKMKEESDKHVRVLKEKINNFLPVKSPADVLILKAHLICEYYLNQILILRGFSSVRGIDRLSFYEKIGKALKAADEEQKNIIDKLIKLNKLRNQVGHELEYRLSEADVDSLGYLNGKEYVLKKYDFDTLDGLLWSMLVGIVIEVGIFVFGLVYEEKRGTELRPASLESIR